MSKSQYGDFPETARVDRNQLQSSEPQEVLLLARERLLEKGWCTGKSWDPKTGKSCLFGAITIVSEHDTVHPLVLASYIERFLPKGCDLVTWNDTPGRTSEEILELLDKALAGIDDDIRDWIHQESRRKWDFVHQVQAKNQARFQG
jgi:hypothetical protein